MSWNKKKVVMAAAARPWRSGSPTGGGAPARGPPRPRRRVDDHQDKRRQVPGAALPSIGKGAFTKEIEQALIAGDIDLAVHSLKDLPTEAPRVSRPGPSRTLRPRDAWIGKNGVPFMALPENAVIATGALRRTAQIKHRYPKP